MQTALRRADSLVTCAKGNRSETASDNTPILSGGPTGPAADHGLTSAPPIHGHAGDNRTCCLTLLQICRNLLLGRRLLGRRLALLAAWYHNHGSQKDQCEEHCDHFASEVSHLFSPYPFQFVCSNPTWSTIIYYVLSQDRQGNPTVVYGVRSVLYRSRRANHFERSPRFSPASLFPAPPARALGAAVLDQYGNVLQGQMQLS